MEKRMIINESGLVMPLPDSVSKNEYLALELTKAWFNKRGDGYSAATMMGVYFDILNRLEKGK